MHRSYSEYYRAANPHLAQTAILFNQYDKNVCLQIVLARDVRKLDNDELYELIRYKYPSITKLNLDVITMHGTIISEELLEVFAQVLNFPIEFFTDIEIPRESFHLDFNTGTPDSFFINT